MAVKEITDENFQEEVIASEEVVVVDFYAVWCKPCKLLAQVMEGLSEEYSSGVKFYKADVETNSDSVAKYGVTGVPAVQTFKAGELIDQRVGLRSRKEIKKDIDEVLNG